MSQREKSFFIGRPLPGAVWAPPIRRSKMLVETLSRGYGFKVVTMREEQARDATEPALPAMTHQPPTPTHRRPRFGNESAGPVPGDRGEEVNREYRPVSEAALKESWWVGKESKRAMKKEEQLFKERSSFHDS